MEFVDKWEGRAESRKLLFERSYCGLTIEGDCGRRLAVSGSLQNHRKCFDGKKIVLTVKGDAAGKRVSEGGEATE